MSSAAPGRRRRRSDIESDDDADDIRESLRQTRSPSQTESSKRARTNEYQSEPESEADIEESMTQSRASMAQMDDYDSDGVSREPSEYQPGAIVRVKLTNFVTYENAEFFPGPNLNMVIGPNGTGKSSLVCAICLGLGYSPKHLGRSTEIGEFVKHQCTEAEVEIELFRRKKDSQNTIIRTQMNRQNNTKFFVNGKLTTHKNVRQIVNKFRIQVDNLCQFLPQDRVAEFSMLSPVELLRETQRAAAPPEMLESHEELRSNRALQKQRETEKAKIEEYVRGLENRQQNLQAEVQKLQERKKIQEQIELLRRRKPFVEYTINIEQNKKFKERKIEAQARFKELERRIEPTIRSIDAKKRHAAQIGAVLEERKAALKKADEETEKFTTLINSLDEEIKAHEGEIDSANRGMKELKQQINKLQSKIAELKARANAPPIEFNASSFNERIRAKNKQLQDTEAESGALLERRTELRRLGGICRSNREKAEQELGEFDSQKGQLMSKLRARSRQVAEAWEWIQEHQESFKDEVYGPALVTCSIKDPRYTAAVESQLQENMLMAFTVQSHEDFATLSNIMHEQMKYTDVAIRTADAGTGRILSANDLQRYGMDGFAIDFIDGPTPVLSMLMGSARLDKCAVTLKDIDDETHKTIIAEKKLNRWATATRHYGITRREEYGPGAVSTTTRAIEQPKFWTDQPVDTLARQEIQARIDALMAEFMSMKAEVDDIAAKLKEVEPRKEAQRKERDDLKAEKDELQKAYSQRAALPVKIAAEEDKIVDKRKQSEDAKAALKNIHVKLDHAAIRKAKQSLQYKEQISKIRACFDGLLEAQVRLIEAESDVAGLEERNVDIVRQRDEEKASMIEAEENAKQAKAIAHRSLNMCKEILAAIDDEDYKGKLTQFPDGTTLESLDNEIQAEESSLECIHAGDPRAIERYESQEKDLARRRQELAAHDENLAVIAEAIAEKQANWESKLDELIAQISEAFSYNFEQIGCAGEVGVHKDEEFEKWELRIKVKFRENETLQILDSHRQSGGERSVSTIFFLMALQALAQAPFRVVDEINQGMDPRNERMVHERMVEIACKEHTSQYFLITPKLLTGLNYDRRMKVMCIASGPNMPVDYKMLDMKRIIGIQRAVVAAG